MTLRAPVESVLARPNESQTSCTAVARSRSVSFSAGVRSAAYGRTYLGNERTTFIIDSDGKVAQILRKVKLAEHDELVLVALAEISAA